MELRFVWMLKIILWCLFYLYCIAPFTQWSKGSATEVFMVLCATHKLYPHFLITVRVCQVRQQIKVCSPDVCDHVDKKHVMIKNYKSKGGTKHPTAKTRNKPQAEEEKLWEDRMSLTYGHLIALDNNKKNTYVKFLVRNYFNYFYLVFWIDRWQISALPLRRLEWKL